MPKYYRSSRTGASSWRTVVLAVLLVGLVAAVMGLRQFWGAPAVAANGPEVTIVQTAGTVFEADIVWPVEVTDLLTDAAESNGTLAWVKADGDNHTETLSFDLTPRTDRGDEIKPPSARATAISDMLVERRVAMNAFDTTSPGRSALAGLQAVKSGGTGPVLLVTVGLDTNDPLDMAALGFDALIGDVVEDLAANNEIPDLDGREVWLVWVPTAGEQAPLRQPQRDYRDQLYTGIIEAAGGTVTRILDTEAAPAGGAGQSPAVPIPAAPETFVPTVESEPPAPTPEGSPDPGSPTVQTCVLPTGVFFHPEIAEFLDRDAAKTAVQYCLGDTILPGTTVDLIGRTACTQRPPDNATALQVSRDRAEAVEALVVELGVDAGNVTTKGVGATQPLRDPCDDGFNRSVEVTVTIPAP